jgi:hypothetical protein
MAIVIWRFNSFEATLPSISLEPTFCNQQRSIAAARCISFHLRDPSGTSMIRIAIRPCMLIQLIDWVLLGMWTLGLRTCESEPRGIDLMRTSSTYRQVDLDIYNDRCRRT